MLSAVAIVGPTGVGKTETSVLVAKKLNTEIISCDSMQVYKGMDIGTAKVTKGEMQGVKHYMIDVAEPTQSFSVGDYVELAKPIMEKIFKEGKIPVIAGGTGLYVDSLLNGTEFGDGEKDLKYRTELESLAQKQGAQHLHNMLESVDLESAKAIHPNNIKRVIRALEYYHITGEPISEHNKKTQKIPSPYKTCYIGLTRNRDELYERIDRRVDIMMQSGLVDEVKRIVKQGVNKSHTAMQALGYKEIYDYLRGFSTLDEAVRLIKRDSRHYAKRQMTWFNRNKNIHWINLSEVSDAGQASELCIDIINRAFNERID